MRVISESTLDLFRGSGRCHWCGRWTARLDPHHIYARGMGGGGRLDVRINLLALCRRCHDEVHAGRIFRCDLLAVVSARESVLQDDIIREIARLRKAAK